MSNKKKEPRNKRTLYEPDTYVISENTKENEELSTFANRFNERLLKKGFTQEKFSEITGISVGSISKYRNGKGIPKRDILEIIADTLDTNTNYLMGKSESPDYKIDKINKKIGLSENAIKELYRFQHELIGEDIDIDIEEDWPIRKTHKSLLTMLSLMIEDSGNLYFLFDSIERYVLQNNKIIEKQKSFKSEKNKKDKLSLLSEITEEKDKLEILENKIQKRFIDCVKQIVEKEMKT